MAMAQPTALRNFIETIDNIPPDIQKCLLTIAQYGCRPDQVQRWYTIVRECFGADNTPATGNLFEHEVVLTPMAPAIGPAASPRISMGPSSMPNAMKDQHGLGLRVNAVSYDGRPELNQTPRAAAYAPSPFVGPPSISSHPGSAIDSVAFSPLTARGAHMTPQSMDGSVSEPDTNGHSLIVPAMSLDPSRMVAPLAQSQGAPFMQQIPAVDNYHQQMSSTEMELYMRAPIATTPARRPHAATHSRAASVTDWSTPPKAIQSSSEPRTKRRKLSTRERGTPSQQTARHQHSVSMSSTQSHSDYHNSPRTPQLSQGQPRPITYMSPLHPAPNAFYQYPTNNMTTSPEQSFQPLPAAAVAEPTPQVESFQHFQVPQPVFLHQQSPHQHNMYSAAPSLPPTTTMTSVMATVTPLMTPQQNQHAFQFPTSTEPFCTT
jgi:hypothetical protein